MKIKNLFESTKKSRFLHVYLRLIPTIIGLSVISSFLTTRPQLAHQLGKQFLTKLQLLPQETQEAPQLDLVTPINNHRSANNQPVLSTNTKLQELAKLITLSLASNPEQESLDLKQLSTLTDYSYSTIAYLAAVNPLPLVTPPTDSWIVDSSQDIIDPDFTEIGSFQQSFLIEGESQFITVVVLASPTTKPTYYTNSELWDNVQQLRMRYNITPFTKDDTLCEIAAIRLNQLLTLGTLDNHAGFSPLINQYKDSSKLTYTNVSENTLAGYENPAKAVEAWNSGENSLLRDPTFTHACTATNQGLSILIAAH